MSSSSITSEERLARLRLIRSENVGPITFHRLMERFPSASEALAALPALSRRGGRARPIKIAPRADAIQEIETLEAMGASLLVHGEADYPPMLAAIEDAPPTLAVRGFTHLLAKPCVAMVGARNASLNGRKFAQELAHDLGQAGFVVVSGLARGIDGAAHQGALDSGTIGVMAGGVDVVYPREHQDLYENIAASGALLSELPPGTQPQARHFPRRNRIVSGLALGTVVVEAVIRSGSLITARLAAEQGREVFAVPGSPRDPRSHGANHLIRNGATLLENADHITEVLTPMMHKPIGEKPTMAYEVPKAIAPSEMDLERARRIIADCLSPTAVAVDEIVRECQLSPAVVQTVLLEMELAGRIVREPGNRVAAL